MGELALFDHFNARAQDNEAAAVIDARGTYSFKQVRAYVAATTERMNAAGRGNGVVVVYGSHGLNIYVGILAALSSASRVLFVDHATPIGAVDHIMTALDASLLINCSGSALPAVVAGAAVIDIAQDLFRDDMPKDESQDAPLKLSCADYAILTSGTTGESKVILQTIASLNAHIRNYAAYLGVRPSDRVLQLASAGWDAGLMDIFVSLQRAGTLCSISPRQHEFDEVRQFIETHNIDTLHMTVPYFRRLYADSGNGYANAKKLVLGGELIYASDIARFNAAFAPSSTLYNAYGPTECTTALYARHQHGAFSLEESWPLAHSVEGVSVSLLQDGSQVTASRAVGELIIQSDLIAKRFDPSSRTAVTITTTTPAWGGDYYSTGDLGYYDDNGHIVITGRNDSVIKVSGQKVSLHEVEAALRSLDGVKDACVLALDEGEEKKMFAAVVPASGLTNGIDLRRQLSRQLPGHKVPKYVLMMPALPLNRNNKLDRAAILEAFRRERPLPSSTEHSIPLEQEVARVLGGVEIDPGLSFLENGGDSLRALQLITALRRRGLQLGLEHLLSDTQIRELTLSSSGDAGVAGAKKETGNWILPTRRFLVTRGIPDLDRWCQTCVLDCSASVAVEKLVDVVRAVLARHITEWVGPHWQIDVATGTLAVEDAVAANEARISLANEMPISVTVVPRELASQIIISCHQFYVDRYSWILLLSELADGTHGDGEDIQSWSNAPQYSAWVAHYQDALESARASEFWRSLPWNSCDTSLVDPNSPFPPKNRFKRKTIQLGSLKVPLRLGASRLARTSNLLLAAILTALATLRGNEYQKLHILDSGREVDGAEVETHGIFGWFTIIFPLVLRVHRDDLFATAEGISDYLALVKPIAHTFGNEFFGQDATRRAAGIYDCDVSYNFLGDIEMSASGDWTVNEFSMKTLHGAPSHHLEITGYLSHGDLVVSIDYDDAIYGDNFVESLQATIARALEPMQPVES
jgi:mycobactin peptide synthetase MbtF